MVFLQTGGNPMAKAVCPKCESEAECFCKKGGGDGGFDEFFLICSACGHREFAKKRIGSPDALFGLFSDEYPNCPFCGQICNKHKAPPIQEKLVMAKKKAKARGNINYNKLREFESLEECAKSPSKKHRLKMVGFPNPEFWGDRIAESSYDFLCIDCHGSFQIPYADIQKEAKV